MDEMVAWLTRCLDETERVARESGSDEWSYSQFAAAEIADGRGRLVARTSAVGGRSLEATTAHIALHDPHSVLTRVKADREIVRLVEDALSYVPVNEDGSGGQLSVGECYVYERTLRLLAYGHRHDAPGYDPAWAPTDPP